MPVTRTDLIVAIVRARETIAGVTARLAVFADRGARPDWYEKTRLLRTKRDASKALAIANSALEAMDAA